VIPGRCEASNSGSRDSGSGACAPSRNDLAHDPQSAASQLFLLLATILACGVTGVALGLLLGFERGLARRFLFLLASDARGLGGRSFFLATLGLGLFGLTRQSRLFTICGECLALGAARGHNRIVVPWLGAEFVQKVLLRLLCRLLPVGETGFPKATH